MSMGGYHFDWSAVLSGQPLDWLLHGMGVTLELTLLAGVMATLLALVLLSLRLAGPRPLQWIGAGYITLFRNTPLAVQLLFWYFGGVVWLPESARNWLNAGHQLFGIGFPSTELLVGIWSMGLFTAAFLAEELRAGVRAVPQGQLEAARSQGFSQWQSLRLVILPQALAHAWQPLVGQYLNLLKNSPLAMSIAVTEIMYQTSQIESFNFHGIEAYAVASVIYLLLGVVLSAVLTSLNPSPAGLRSNRRAD